ncbi:MAG: branched-chain amino acid ABC transporter substrate-binding protein, partial [Ottowia sp.]|nr:branched-chain amino acid ABC transporter substrate-binding protein [Ottowia sp.]
FSAPLTGAQAMYGKDLQNGVILALEEFNASKPKIGGKDIKLVLLSEDDQADPRIGTQIAQKMVDRDIKAMFGNLNSSVAIPASRTYYLAGIPQSTTATAPEYTRQGFKTTFRMLPSDVQQGSAMGIYAVKGLGFKEIAIIDDRTAYGQGLADEFDRAAKAAGAKIVRREFTNDKAQDFKPILTSLKRVKPQAVFYGGNAVQAAPLARQMRELGITAVLMGGDMVKMDKFIKIAERSAEGVIVSLGGRPQDKMPGGPAFKLRYEKRFGVPVDVYAPYSYDGAMAIFTAMKKAGSVEPSKYLPFLADIEMPGVTSQKIAYDRYGDLRDNSITIYKVTDGAWKVLDTISGDTSK